MKSPIEENFLNQYAKIEFQDIIVDQKAAKCKIEGKLIIKCLKEYEVKSIKISIVKREFVSFTSLGQKKSIQSKNITKLNFTHDNYEKLAKIVISNQAILNKSEEIFPFCIEVSSNLNGSFISKKKQENFEGSIEYFLKVETICPDQLLNLNKIFHFEIFSGKNPNHKDQLVARIQFKFGIFSKKQSDFYFKLKLDNNTFYILQKKKNEIELDNTLNSKSISRIFLSLIEDIEAKGKADEKTESLLKLSNVLCKWDIGGVEARQTKVINIELPIKEEKILKEVFTSKGKILKREYRLLIEPDLEGCNLCSKKSIAELPFYISNFPIHNF